jgi:hypothetical protein
MEPEESLHFISELVTMAGVRRETDQKDPMRIDINVALRWPDQTDTFTKDVIYSITHDGWDLDIRQGEKTVSWLELVKERAKECWTS